MIGIQPYKTILDSFQHFVLVIQVNGEIYKIVQNSAVSINITGQQKPIDSMIQTIMNN